MIITPLDKQYHKPETFREQIAVLYPAEIDEQEGQITFIRSYKSVGLPGSASFDPKRPGMDSHESWEIIDGMVEKEGVRGVFHTHPSGFHDFSNQDWKCMRGFAVANGEKPLFWGVQSLDCPQAHFVAMYMKHSQIFCIDLGWFEYSSDSTLITLPLPPSIGVVDDMFVISMG